MNFLNQLGIDLNLLVAQIINFGVLLWLLSKFLYKPIINRIEIDENELRQSKIQKEKLDLEIENFEKQKNEEIKDIKKRSRKIIEEAENIASEIKSRSKKESEKIKNIILSKVKEQAESYETQFKKKYADDFKKASVEEFKDRLEKSISLDFKKNIQKQYFKFLLGNIEKINIQEIKSKNVLSATEDTFLSLDGINRRKKTKKEFKDIVADEIGDIIFEYTFDLTKKERDELKDVISKKIGVDVDALKIVEKKNPELLSGFRLELAGLLMESNFLNEINNATKTK